ncbi:hypothetical protein [Nocardioides speluncae]|uniref:hypothetical protein n=1 Tax=Nocardioides speluncae TaxID=2670337 RepID=UPI0012B18711|nr:hypothetical protein [Nocardioides speluncae]
MTNTRPLLLGYIRADALTTERDVEERTSDLAAFADSEGYALGTVFIERNDNAPAAFEALMTEATRTGVSAVVVPGPRLLPCGSVRVPQGAP